VGFGEREGKTGKTMREDDEEEGRGIKGGIDDGDGGRGSR
jgi:hypothetical protein